MTRGLHVCRSLVGSISTSVESPDASTTDEESNATILTGINAEAHLWDPLVLDGITLLAIIEDTKHWEILHHMEGTTTTAGPRQSSERYGSLLIISIRIRIATPFCTLVQSAQM